MCYDRARKDSVKWLQRLCQEQYIDLLEIHLEDGAKGPRCPSKAWNMALSLLPDAANVFCMSSDMVMAPHSLDMAFHLTKAAPDCLIVSRAEHCGQCYKWIQTLSNGIRMQENRTITCSYAPSPLGFAWMMPMRKFREVGGFDEVYMNGFCYEDDDFVIRLWKAGTDFVFCDDIMGFHLEHKRDHLKDRDGRVSINANIFKARWGDLDYLRKRKFCAEQALCNVGLGFIMHTHNDKLIRAIFERQRNYGREKPWRAVLDL